MKVAGIVSEYNPFHNGHKLHIELTKNQTGANYVIAIMSGNFVQRGEPAICDKFIRTKTALLNGIDLVIELPYLYSTASAEVFSLGAISTLSKLNSIDYLSFGSESGDMNLLDKISTVLANEPDDYKKKLKDILGEGVSFPTARMNTLNELYDFDKNILASPNNILAIEYLKALKKTKNNICPITIKRVGNDYHSDSLSHQYSSASAIRKAMSDNNILYENSIPKNEFEKLTYLIDKGLCPSSFDNLSNVFHYIISQKSSDSLKKNLYVDEGLENRILSVASESYFLSEIANKIKTKRYTYSRIQRMLLHIIFDTSKDFFNSYVNVNLTPYARVLGFRRKSSELLSYICKNSEIPVITNLKHADKLLSPNSLLLLKKELWVDSIYSLSLPKNPKQIGNTYQESNYHTPFIID